MARRKQKAGQSSKKIDVISPADQLVELFGPFRDTPRPDPEYMYVTKAPFGCKSGHTTRPELRPLQVAGNAPAIRNLTFSTDSLGS